MDIEAVIYSRRLSDLHRQVLFLLSRGLRNSEVAHQLGKSERTIKSYVSQLLLVFDVTNRTELVGVLAQESVIVRNAESGRLSDATVVAHPGGPLDVAKGFGRKV